MCNTGNTIRVTTDLSQIEFEDIYAFITTSYWAKGIGRHTLAKALRHSLCFAAIDEISPSPILLGFARVIPLCSNKCPLSENLNTLNQGA